MWQKQMSQRSLSVTLNLMFMSPQLITSHPKVLCITAGQYQHHFRINRWIRWENSCKQVHHHCHPEDTDPRGCNSRSSSQDGKMKRFASGHHIWFYPHSASTKAANLLTFMFTPPKSDQSNRHKLHICHTNAHQEATASLHSCADVFESTEVFCVKKVNRSWDKMPSLWWDHRELKKGFYCEQWLVKSLLA